MGILVGRSLVRSVGWQEGQRGKGTAAVEGEREEGRTEGVLHLPS